MGIAVSMFLIAAGAIVRYAVTAEGRGFNVGTAGMVLMVVEIVGAVLSIVFWASLGRIRTAPSLHGRHRNH